MVDLKVCTEMAIKSALRNGYDYVIIKDNDGTYSHSKEYDGCCPDWYGKIINKVSVSWENGILKAELQECN